MSESNERNGKTQSRDSVLDNSPLANENDNTQIIGNINFRYISRKSYRKFDTEKALKIAELLEKNNIKYSAKITGKTTTITVSKENLERLHGISESITEDPTDKAIRLINEYCEKEFESKANFSNMDHVDLAYTTDENTELPIEVYADLETFRIVKEYDKLVVSEELFDSLDDMCVRLANLEFDDLISLTDSEKSMIKSDIESLEKIEEFKDLSESIENNSPLANEITAIQSDILTKDCYDLENYTVSANGVYDIPLIINNEQRKRFEQFGLIPSDEQKEIYFSTNGNNWNAFQIRDGNNWNSVNMNVILSKSEIADLESIESEIIKRNSDEQIFNLSFESPENNSPLANENISQEDSEQLLYTIIKPELAADEWTAITTEFFSYETAWHDVEQRISEIAESYRKGEDITEKLGKYFNINNSNSKNHDIEKFSDKLIITHKETGFSKEYTWSEIGIIQLQILKDRFKEDTLDTIRWYPETADKYNALIERMEKEDYPERNTSEPSNTQSNVLTKECYDLENYTFSVGLYDIPLVINNEQRKRFEQFGLIPSDEQKDINFSTDGKNWNKFQLRDRFGNRWKSVDMNDVLSENEITDLKSTLSKVVEINSFEQMSLFDEIEEIETDSLPAENQFAIGE